MIDHGDFQIASIPELDKLGPMILTTARSIISQGKAAHIVIEEHKPRRSTQSNSLYWEWLTVMAKHFSKGKAKFSKEDMHDLMRHKFLGYESRMIGKTELQPALKSTADLDTPAMHAYMVQIDAWCADHGFLLPRPEDSDYETYARAAA